MTNAQSLLAHAFQDIVKISIPLNMMGLGAVVWKIRKIKDPMINKTFSKISIWMLA